MPPVSVLTTQTYLTHAIPPTQTFDASQTDSVEDIEERTGDMENRELGITLIRDLTHTEVQCAESFDEDEQQTFVIPTTLIASSTPMKAPKPATTDSSTSPMIKSMSTFNHSLSLPLDQPLSKKEENFNTHFVRRKLKTDDPDKQTIICKTGGQPLVLQKSQDQEKPQRWQKHQQKEMEQKQWKILGQQ